jgi:hypothetical protein
MENKQKVCVEICGVSNIRAYNKDFLLIKTDGPQERILFERKHVPPRALAEPHSFSVVSVSVPLGRENSSASASSHSLIPHDIQNIRAFPAELNISTYTE